MFRVAGLELNILMIKQFERPSGRPLYPSEIRTDSFQGGSGLNLLSTTVYSSFHREPYKLVHFCVRDC
jgi:hypothetical protein